MKNKAYLAAIFVLGGHGAHMVLRLGSNLILTRLLVPEFFGIMALAQVFIMGLWFISDVGIGTSIIRSDRSDDPNFLNTAWTLSIFRGLLLFMMVAAISIPVARIYESPILAKILPVIGLTFIFSSAASTSIYTLNKQVRLGMLTVVEIVTQVLGIVAMISLAYIYKNVWALVIGSLVSTVCKTLWSHFLEQHTKNRICLEKESVGEIISFGKWIFVSTLMMFLATQADRLLLGKLFPLAMLGIYNIAVMFAEIPKQILGKLSNKVIFPLMANFSDLPRPEFRKKILSKRKLLLFPLVLMVAICACFGDVIISLLYDNRYHQAGWMLQLLALGMWPFILNATIDRCFYAIGKPIIPAAGNFAKFLYMIIAVPSMYRAFGPLGGVLAVTFNDLPVYIVNGIGLKKENLTCFAQDLTFTLLLFVIMFLFFLIRAYFDLGSPWASAFSTS